MNSFKTATSWQLDVFLPLYIPRLSVLSWVGGCLGYHFPLAVTTLNTINVQVLWWKWLCDICRLRYTVNIQCVKCSTCYSHETSEPVCRDNLLDSKRNSLLNLTGHCGGQHTQVQQAVVAQWALQCEDGRVFPLLYNACCVLTPHCHPMLHWSVYSAATKCSRACSPLIG